MGQMPKNDLLCTLYFENVLRDAASTFLFGKLATAYTLDCLKEGFLFAGIIEKIRIFE
ncbi:protein of unknown function [Shewanella benthica]|uniref:Uncharacterized protein n=1 Tax=Shewanella benthica TaxID=43661 RepID=A0A330M318_9GAMM|nr:protein of unknown function [Shewanella benthica]